METMIQMPFLAISAGLTLLTMLFCMEQGEVVEDTPKSYNKNPYFTMNWWTKKGPVLAGSLGIVLIAVFSCNKTDNGTLTEDLRLTASNDLYFNPLNLQVMDAGDETNYPTDAIVTIGGRDKAKILSVIGERQIPLKDGLIELGVANSNKPSDANPLEFNVLIQAAGYLDAVKSFKIGDGTEPVQEVIKMVKAVNLPNGVLYTSKQAGLDGNSKVTADVNITTVGASVVSITLKEGTKLFGKNGNALSGNVVKMSLWRFDATKEAAVDAMPGGVSFSNATDKRNNSLGNGVFTPFGFYYLTMTVNGVEAKTLSIPLDVAMSIPIEIKRTVNSLNESPSPVRKDDVLPVWSLNAGGQWVFEAMSSAAVPLRNGFNVKFAASTLSTYYAVADPSSVALYNWLRDGQSGAVPTTQACTNAGLRIQSNLPVVASGRYYAKVRHAYNPWMTVGSFYSDFSNTRSINLSNVLGNGTQKVRLDVFDSEGGTNLHRTDVIVPCNRPYLNLTNRIVRPRNSFTFNISMNALCRTGAQTTNVLPTANMYFAEMNGNGNNGNGKLRWRYMGRMVKGQVSTDKLIKGVDYQFLIARGPLAVTMANLGAEKINVPTDNTARTVTFQNTSWNLNQKVSAFPIDANTYQLSLADFASPPILCDKYTQYFR